MNLIRLGAAFLVAMVASPAGATVLTDWQTGCQINVPDEWRTTYTPPEVPGFGVRSYNTKDLTSVDFNVDDQKETEPLTESTRSVTDFLRIFKDTSTITDRSRRTINGCVFLVLSALPKPGTNTNRVTAWFIIVKGHACRIILSVKGQDPDKTDVLNGIIKSFSVTEHVLSHSPVLSAQDRLDEALKNNPFNFYGKVVDENGQPVPDAKAVILVQGELGSTKGNTEYDVQTDQDGLFKLEGVHSFGVIVTASKDGYYTLPDKHYGTWFWIIRNDTMPTKETPAIFPLQKKGPTEPLIDLETASIDVPTDGTVREFNLEKRRVIKEQPGTFNVQMWVDAHDPKSGQPFHWKFRITVPGGGIQPYSDKYQFFAPSSGYREFVETEMTPGVSGWSDSREQDYFVKLGDGNYARVRFEIRTLGEFFVEGGYLNPSGSRILSSIRLSE